MAHTIRLRGAWAVEREHDADGSGTVKFTRQFGCSAGLKAARRVQLVIQKLAGRASIELNGNLLGEIPVGAHEAEGNDLKQPTNFDVAALLRPRNTLVVRVLLAEREAAASGEPGLVRLEIE